MSLTSVDLVTANNETSNFSFNPNASYQIKKITGLDADEITPKFYGFSIDGQKKFYDFGLKPRLVSVLLQLNPDFSIGETYKYLRDELYKKVLPTRTGLVDLLFNDGAATIGKISGFINKFEAPLFTKTPTVQITLLCKDPMIRSSNSVVLSGAEINSGSTLTIVDSISTAPHGFQLEILFTSPQAIFTIEDSSTNPEWIFTVTPVSPGFLTGDVLYVSSEFGSKNAYMVRSSVTTYLMDRINPESTWPIIFPGNNAFYFDFYSSIDLNYLEYSSAYWGL